MVLEMDCLFLDIYWMNVVDFDFLFVGVIEYINFELLEIYGGKWIVYLFKYFFIDIDMYGYDVD